MNAEIRDRKRVTVIHNLKVVDSPILTGLQIYHNYLPLYVALDGARLAEKAGITVEGDNEWLTLIQNASKSGKLPHEN